MSEESSPSMVDRLYKPGFANLVNRLGEEADQAKAETAEAKHETKLAKRDASAAHLRVRMAARSLMRAVPGIVLSSLGFAFASEADGDDRVALMGLLLFVAGTAAYVWAIGLTSGRLKPDSGPCTQDRST